MSESKKKTKETLLKDQERVDLELRVDHSETGFDGSKAAPETDDEDQEITLFADGRPDEDDDYLDSDATDTFEETLKQGVLIDQKYEVEKLLGVGGMGSVYLAKHVKLGTRVALKVLHRHLVNTPDALKRFKTEAKAAHALMSPNLVSVLDYGVLTDGQPYLTMHCIEGRNLADHLLANGPLSIAETFMVVKQVAAALEEAHAKGIVHRDIKPSNILIEGNVIKEGSIKVVDFGISKGVGNDLNTQHVTHTGQIFGSPFYMSPEQCKGETVDFRTDLYSLGCVMFECLTGSKLFEGKNAVQTFLLHCNETPPVIGVHGKAPQGLKQANAILKKLVAKKPSERHASAKALHDEIQNIQIEHADWKFFPSGISKSQAMRDRMTFLTLATIMLSLMLFLYMYQSSNGTFVNTDKRLHELYKLAGNAFDLEQDNLQKNVGYLEEAAEIARKTYGENSFKTAEAYYRLGKFPVPKVRINGNLKPREEALKRAIAITDHLSMAAPTGSSEKTAAYELCKHYISTLAQETYGNDWNAVKIYQSLSIGTHHHFARAYSIELQKNKQFLKAALFQVRVRTEDNESLPSLVDLQEQTADSMTGSYCQPKASTWQTAIRSNITVSHKGNQVFAQYWINPATGQNAREQLEKSTAYWKRLQGEFHDGYAEFRDSTVSMAFVMVGKYLVILKHDNQGESFDFLLVDDEILVPIADKK